MGRKDHPHTKDGRYFVARGRLCRCTNPALSDADRRKLIKHMMQARMAERSATSDAERTVAHAAVDAAKIALGERGAVWWEDGAPDYSGRDPAQTPYADWWQSICEE